MEFYTNRRALQSGRGLGNIFGSLFRKALPIFKSVGVNAVKAGKSLAKSEVGKELAKTALTSGVDVLDKMIDGEKNAAIESAHQSLRRVKNVAKKSAKDLVKRKVDDLLSDGIKKKKKKITKQPSKRKYIYNKKSIFQ
jgi:N-methylhydantoinase B/oxoprolinase/acetone carboxylase alpha subunit